MPRFAYWTILLGTDPTAFRARHREDLVPTLVQLQRRHPEAVLKWVERNQVWDSPEQAREARERARAEARQRPPTWRPGGDHRDPRQVQRPPRDVRRRAMARRYGWKRRDAAQEGDTHAPPREPERGTGTPPRSGAGRRRKPAASTRARHPDRPGTRRERPAGPQSRPEGPRSPATPDRKSKPQDRRPERPPRPGPHRRPGPGRPRRPGGRKR